jgi:hypothetical protein
MKRPIPYRKEKAKGAKMSKKCRSQLYKFPCEHSHDSQMTQTHTKIV